MENTAAKMDHYALLAGLEQEVLENYKVNLVGAESGGGLNHM